MTAVDRAPADEAFLLRRAAVWADREMPAGVTPLRVATVARDHGCDFATAVLYASVRHAHLGSHEIALANPHQPAVIGAPEILIVPGAFHRERMNTGADGRRLQALLASLGYRSTILATESFGALRKNARTLLDYLSRGQDEMLLFALSKGASEVKTALGMEGTGPFSRVRGCITLSGLWNGTPYVTWMRQRKLRCLGIRVLFACRGYEFSSMREIESHEGSALDFEPDLPSRFRLVHVVGFPLERHLTTPVARRAYRRLRPLGPSDGGGILLADAARFPGTLLPVWGADHYLQPSPFVTAAIAGAIRLALNADQIDSSDGTTRLEDRTQNILHAAGLAHRQAPQRMREPTRERDL
jgi:hypothetical protein